MLIVGILIGISLGSSLGFVAGAFLTQERIDEEKLNNITPDN